MSAASHPGNNLYLYPDTVVRTNATLLGLDYTATTTGNVIVQVKRGFPVLILFIEWSLEPKIVKTLVIVKI